MTDVALLITFKRDGSVRCHPILDVAGHGLELADRLHAFCRALFENPDAASCAVGLHDHRPGDCVPRAGAS